MSEDAQRTLRREHRRRFRRLVAGLNKLKDDVKEDFPEVNYYLSNDTLNLMSGPSHGGRGQQPLYENVLDSITLKNSGGGDW